VSHDKVKRTRRMRQLLRRVKLIYEIEREKKGEKRLPKIQGMVFEVTNGRRGK